MHLYQFKADWKPFSKNVFVGDNIAFRAGTGGDLSISHNGTQSNINNVTGPLDIHCTTDALKLSGTKIDIGNIKPVFLEESIVSFQLNQF